jgi:hypothetical protein
MEKTGVKDKEGLKNKQPLLFLFSEQRKVRCRFPPKNQNQKRFNCTRSFITLCQDSKTH